MSSLLKMYDDPKLTRKFNLFLFTKFYEINRMRQKSSQGGLT